jgi:hypothetical protein
MSMPPEAVVPEAAEPEAVTGAVVPEVAGVGLAPLHALAALNTLARSTIAAPVRIPGTVHGGDGAMGRERDRFISS